MESIYFKPDGDRLEILLHEKFGRRERIQVAEGGVLTAVDRRMFMGLELLYYSLSLSHDVPFAVVDLGMLPEQRRWCEDRGLLVCDIPEQAMIFDQDTYYWQTWNKPVYIERSPFPQTLWIDADAVVRGSLATVFRLMQDGPFLVEESHAPRGYTSANKSMLYRSRKFYLPEHRKSPVFLNAGVLGFHLDRDADLLRHWAQAIRNAWDDARARASISWWDQGALLWTLESLGKCDLIRRGDWSFNYPGRDAQGRPFEVPDPIALLESLADKDPAVIRHFSGHTKPFQTWEDKVFHLEMTDLASTKLKVLLLSHEEREFDFFPRRPVLSPTNLATLPIGVHQRNELAESRIFLDPHLMDRFEGREYVGLASSRWNNKYASMGVLNVVDLHRVKDRLAPDRVFVALTSERDWVETTCRANAGMEGVLGELADFTGLPLFAGQSFWSNNFICHREVFKDYLRHFRAVFDHFTGKYQNRFDFLGMDTRRTPSYFYEAVTVHYFANRADLTVTRLIDPRRLPMA